ncbi:hypothetical protein [Marinomonas mediterranea]|jgi:hypothetical protein|uniref:Uncharacterized protein n=1 Tax=Marinomonas mediterranea (strain ATCC 700492 / JCM 21426 / NBRC 103028 / MMB-1) TaxID=717774 RepID=F2JYE9_MARM1|nr:hypothetical protein [Marinomonas mediterranea]ADZ91980.1 hypothetical protein Marme_2753 [Marinomonas mediterranea MMB-1]WCN18059.1 hypothetical protein GV053_13900 [Marinomonas mediterranea MMB-1]
MGTVSTQKLQTEIKSILGKLKWSHKKLARVVYAERNDFDNEDEIVRFEESFKKDLSRPTTKPERLSEYLMILSQQDEFQKSGMILPVYTKSGVLSETMEEGMKDISLFINGLITDEKGL